MRCQVQHIQYRMSWLALPFQFKPGLTQATLQLAINIGFWTCQQFSQTPFNQLDFWIVLNKLLLILKFQFLHPFYCCFILHRWTVSLLMKSVWDHQWMWWQPCCHRQCHWQLWHVHCASVLSHLHLAPASSTECNTHSVGRILLGFGY